MTIEVIKDLSDLREGDLMFGPIHGFTGAAVGAAQLVLATAEPGMIWKQGPRRWFRIRHTGVVTKRAEIWTSGLGAEDSQHIARGPLLVQAMPGGIEQIELDANKWNSEYVYIRPSYAEGQGFNVAMYAMSYIGRPYDFATYGAIPLYRRGVDTARIREIIAGKDTMMCSRTVDAALDDAGWHLFDDNRLPGNVTPSELYRRVLEMPFDAISMIDGRDAGLHL